MKPESEKHKLAIGTAVFIDSLVKEEEDRLQGSRLVRSASDVLNMEAHRADRYFQLYRNRFKFLAANNPFRNVTLPGAQVHFLMTRVFWPVKQLR